MAHTDKHYSKPGEECGTTNGEAFFTRMKEKSEHLEHELKRYGDNTEQYIKKNPVKSTILAGIAGLILGKFLSR